MKIYISGGSHVALSKEEQRQEIEEALGDKIDVVFQEGYTETASDREMWLNIAFSPFLFLMLIAYSLSLRILSSLLSSDRELREGIVKDYDSEIIKVDRPFHSMITEARKAWGLLNVLVIIPPAIFFVAQTSILVVVSFFIIAMMTLFLAFVAGTASGRNMAIAMEIGRIARTNAYQTGVAVVGGTHKEPLEKILDDKFPEVDLVTLDD